MPFTLRNIKEDLEDIGSRFDGAPDLEFRSATGALENSARLRTAKREIARILTVRHEREARQAQGLGTR